jgi:hypothetical protein
MASWGADHLALSRMHHDDILRQAREAQFIQLAMKGKRSRPALMLDFLVARRPRRSVRPAYAEADRRASALRTYAVAPTEL